MGLETGGRKPQAFFQGGGEFSTPPNLHKVFFPPPKIVLGWHRFIWGKEKTFLRPFLRGGGGGNPHFIFFGEKLFFPKKKNFSLIFFSWGGKRGGPPPPQPWRARGDFLKKKAGRFCFQSGIPWGGNIIIGAKTQISFWAKNLFFSPFPIFFFLFCLYLKKKRAIFPFWGAPRSPKIGEKLNGDIFFFRSFLKFFFPFCGKA